MLKLMLIYLRQKKVKKEYSPITSSRKKKSKSRKSHKVKDTDTPPLVSVPTSKKEKQSLKPLSQDEQSRLEKIIKKIIEEVLNEKFGTITTPFSTKSWNF